ncbi:MAG TPA: DUF2200 family protein, partial [Microbacterium sp.]|nr:DUF2200 family protein [Microbacterium sp.]
MAHRIFTTSFASVYPLYVAKAERKGRSKGEVDEIIAWLTGFDDEALAQHLERETSFEEFFADADLNPRVSAITGVVCGVRVEEIEDPLMQNIRYLDKLIDELAEGFALIGGDVHVAVVVETLARFGADLASFLEELQSKNYNGASAPKIVLYSPLACEGTTVPDTPARNRLLSLYTNTMQRVADSLGIPCVDLYSASRRVYQQDK